MNTIAALTSRLVFIDLETTGANPLVDRITEIGLVEVVDGIVTRWSTLINPERDIPAFIQRLTGIDDKMVADAPRFAEVAEELHGRLHGKLFIAHNARFDYGFVKQEFKRLGSRFQCDVLCTVRLSRSLFPEHHKHNLDSLISRHGLHADARHRALADAELIWQFWQRLTQEKSETAILTALQQQLFRPTLPPHLDPAVLDDLPEAPGVFRLHGEDGTCLQIARASNLRRQVYAHFSKSTDAAIHRLEWQETLGELGALLLATPVTRQTAFAWRLEEVEPGDFRPRLVTSEEFDLGRTEGLYGPYASRREATNALRRIVEGHKLSPALLDMEKTRLTPAQCKNSQGREAIGQHSAHLMSALAKLKIKPWPWAGPIGLIERDDFRCLEEVHVLDAWRHLGTAHAEADIPALLARDVAFDLNIYKLLKTQLGKGKLDIRQLTSLRLP